MYHLLFIPQTRQTHTWNQYFSHTTPFAKGLKYSFWDSLLENKKRWHFLNGTFFYKKMKLKGMSHDYSSSCLHELILKVNGVVTFISGFVCVCVYRYKLLPILLFLFTRMNNKNMLKVDLLVQLRNSSRQNREVAARLGGEGGARAQGPPSF